MAFCAVLLTGRQVVWGRFVLDHLYVAIYLGIIKTSPPERGSFFLWVNWNSRGGESTFNFKGQKLGENHKYLLSWALIMWEQAINFERGFSMEGARLSGDRIG